MNTSVQLACERPLISDPAVRSTVLLCFPPVLDACCGGRMFWFDPKDDRALFVDRRRESHQADKRPGRNPLIVDPDMMADFTDLPFPSGAFDHVVFDPPHRTTLTTESDGKTWLARKYGRLLGDWKDMLRQGFAECFRVLRPGGTLIFKWCEYDIPVSEVLALTPEKPLYGHRSGKQSKTHWIAFLKHNNEVSDSRE
jgi:SAM-dependent methyltransferase